MTTPNQTDPRPGQAEAIEHVARNGFFVPRATIENIIYQAYPIIADALRAGRVGEQPTPDEIDADLAKVVFDYGNRNEFSRADLGAAYVQGRAAGSTVPTPDDAATKLRAMRNAVLDWAMRNEIDEPPLDWAGLGAILNDPADKSHIPAEDDL